MDLKEAQNRARRIMRDYSAGRLQGGDEGLIVMQATSDELDHLIATAMRSARVEGQKQGAEAAARAAFGGPLAGGRDGQRYREVLDAVKAGYDQPLLTAEDRRLAHLELVRQGGRQHIIEHLAGEHWADAAWKLREHTTDDLLRKHAELEGIDPR